MIVGNENASSNLDCFLRMITPVVQSQFLPKSEMRNLNSLWHPWDRERVEFFRLEDLWECFDEWSAYGAGVPIVMNDEESLVQYYVPYLSAIQIFTSISSLNRLREEAETGECETRDSFSEENDSDKSWRSDGCSSDDGGFEQHNGWSPNERLGHLYFQYFEKLAPYARVPLMDKMSELARRYPGSKSLRSVDLSPASWMAVAWYPIYHIPMGRTIKDLSTCFLTYHTLSSSFQDMDLEDEMDCGNGKVKSKEREGRLSLMDCGNGKVKSKEREGRLSLPPFGLATYKMQGNVWVPGKSGGSGSRDQERLLSLLSVADSWLKQLMVQHHDFNYFTGIRRRIDDEDNHSLT